MASMVLSENTTNEMPIEQVDDIQEKDGSVSEAQDLPEDSNIKVEKQDLGPMDGYWQPDWLYVFISTPLLIMIAWSYTVGCRGGNEKGKKRDKCIIVTGESGSGKTSLLYYLAKHVTIPTVSSQETTEVKIKLNKEDVNSKPTNFLDIPGHTNFRHYLYEELDNAKSILFLIDSSKKENVYNSASFLYELFIQQNFIKKQIPVLIVSNKRDLERSVEKTELRNELIKEIERTKLSKRSHTNESNDNDYLVDSNERFSFESVKGGKIKFVNYSIEKQEVLSKDDLQIFRQHLE